MPACADRALLLATYEAHRDQVRQVLQALLKPIPAKQADARDEILALAIKQRKAHNAKIIAAAATLGIDLTT